MNSRDLHAFDPHETNDVNIGTPTPGSSSGGSPTTSGAQICHPQTLVVVPGFDEAEVDHEIAPLVYALWRAGLRTRLSCQANGPEDAYVWVQFDSAEDAQGFLDRTVGRYDREEESLYQRAAGVWDAGQLWLYSCEPVDRNLTLQYLADGSLDEQHLTRFGDWAFAVSVRFPRADLLEVQRLFAEASP